MENFQTIVEYTGGTPTVTGTVTLFNSVTAFPPGGSYHLLSQNWFRYTLTIGSAGGNGTGTVTGSFSVDKGTTWTTFYTATTLDGTASAPTVSEDDVYTGMFKDVRFQFTNAVEAPTVFVVSMAISSSDHSAKVTPNDVIIDSRAIS